MSSFLIDPHVHTAEVSACSHLPAVELVRLYHARRHDAVIVTDHFTQEYFEGRGFRSLRWSERVACFLQGYRRACREGKRLGVRVFLGAEVRLPGSVNDYLVYGLDESQLRKTPPLHQLDLPSLSSLVRREGGIVVQAHPFRSMCTPADPRLLDGVETFNGNPRHRSGNDLAEAFAERHGLLRLSGSDAHQEQDVGRGGMLLPRAVKSLQDWLAALAEAQLVSSPEAA